MRFQVKPRIIALAIRVMLPILSMSGSSPEMAAIGDAAPNEAGLASTAPARRASIMVYGGPRSTGLPWPAFNGNFASVMELGDVFAPIAVADATGWEFVARCFLIRNAW